MHLPNSVFRNIHTPGVHPPRPETFHQEAHRATGIQHSRRRNALHDLIRDGSKKFEPFVIALVGPATTMLKVIAIVAIRWRSAHHLTARLVLSSSPQRDAANVTLGPS